MQFCHLVLESAGYFSVLQKSIDMKTTRRIPYYPFEELEDFSDLKSLISHILKSLKVSEVKVVMPAIFDTKLISDPQEILPVYDILVGDATFNYIRYKADYVLSNVKGRIEKVNQNSQLSIADKLQLFEEVKKSIWYDYQYFNSMNPIRYMSSYKWKISFTEEENGKIVSKELDYPNSKIDLKDGHWNMIENTFLIRRHLLYEILYLIDVELQKLKEELADTKYTWLEEGPYEIYELLLSLIASKRVKYVKGDENTFIHDFLYLFGKSDEDFAYSRGKVLDRVHRSQFLLVLEEALKNYGRSSKEETTI